MYTAAALTDLHARTHESFGKLLDHGAEIPVADLARTLDGFGYGSILLQLQHVIGAERYWIGVLRGLMLVDEDDSDRESIDALRGFRERTVADTVAYLSSTSDAGLNEPREMTTWGDRQVDLVPAHVVLRTQRTCSTTWARSPRCAGSSGAPCPPDSTSRFGRTDRERPVQPPEIACWIQRSSPSASACRATSSRGTLAPFTMQSTCGRSSPDSSVR